MFEQSGAERFSSSRRHRRLRGTIALGTLMLSWYFAAALDQPLPERQAATEAPGAFDEAFIAANAAEPVDCLDIDNAPESMVHIAHVQRLQAQNAEMPVNSRPTVNW
jgi:hypothetical protein